MRHSGTVTLQTPRLILRRFSIEDAPAVYRNWTSDPEVTKYLTWPVHKSVVLTGKVMKDWIQQYDNPDSYQWAITVRENGNEPIGSIAVTKIDNENSIIQVGYCIGRKWWNHGITSEALSAVIRYLFTVVGVNRIEARHDPRNPNSGKVMLKCGMTYEGTLRQAGQNNQGRCDASMYAILSSEFSNMLLTASKQ